jgi:hypothetical protein
MKQIKHYVLSCAFIVVSLLLVSSVYPFRLEHPDGNRATTGPFPAPSDNPPFLHWDLREFPDCVVPYSFHDGTPDIAGLAEFDAVDAAFAEWQAVVPAVIAFERVLPGQGASNPLTLDEHNMIGWNGFTPRPGDDICLLGPGACVIGAACAAGAHLIGAGPDGWLTTVADGDDEYFDTGGGNYVIRDGGNMTIETEPNRTLWGGDLAITAIFFEVNSGRILESDILFHDTPALVWVITPNQAATPTGAEVQTVAMHEIGHFIGLGHMPSGPDWDFAPFGNFPTPADGDHDWNGNGVIDTPIMDSPTQTALHTLHQDDKDGCNFLYTPDLGDAPDPFANIINRYPSLVHSPIRFGRKLNDIDLDAIAEGAEHLFGILFDANGALIDRADVDNPPLGNFPTPREDMDWNDNGVLNPADGLPDYQFEWLGARIDDSPLECESRQIDLDLFDDGVMFGAPFAVGVATPVVVLVSTNGLPGRYVLGNVFRHLFVYGWFDWNGDGIWDVPGERELHWEGIPGATVFASPNFVGAAFPGNNIVLTFNVTPPALPASGEVWTRFRLDYGESFGLMANIDGTLNEPKGAAQFGEVEDYIIKTMKAKVWSVTCPFPGDPITVPVNIFSGVDIGGFKLYIEYDPTTLTLLGVERGDLIDDFSDYYDEYTHTMRYKFQYFEHRQLPCEQQCETYKIKIVGIADMPDGWINGPLKVPNGELIKLKFQVAKDANLQDMFLPIKFDFDYDFDSLSNSFSSTSGESLLVDVNWPGETSDRIFPSIIFKDGGVKVHSDAYCWCGDINMNELPYEIADAVMFANALLTSPEEVFLEDYDIQVLATDVNKDGFVLSIADFVFLVRIILEDISPKHKLTPSTDLVNVTLTTQGNAVKVLSNSNSAIGAGLYVFKHTGEVKNLTLLTDMDMKYHDANGELKVLVYSFEGKSIPAGNVELFSFESQNVELVEVEAADFYGSALKSTITTKVLPTRFALMNNYPNPFNLSTSISFALPVDSKVSLKLYNVAGQLVKSFEDRYEAGVHTIVWDGTNTKGEAVSSGIYFYKLVAGDYSCTRKMVLVK